jgi:hypothetical protein
MIYFIIQAKLLQNLSLNDKKTWTGHDYQIMTIDIQLTDIRPLTLKGDLTFSQHSNVMVSASCLAQVSNEVK